jgi:hypothetical protein
MDGDFPNFSPPSEIERPESKKRIISILALIAIIAGGAFLSILALRIYDPLWNPFRPSPEKVLEKMAVEMEMLRSASNKTEFILVAKNEGKVTLNLKSENKWEKTGADKRKSKGNFSLTFSSQREFAGGKIMLAGETLTENETSYLKFTTLPDIPLLSMMGIDLSQLKGEWIKIDQQSVTNFFEKTGSKKLTPEMEKQFKEEMEKQEKMQKELQEEMKKILKERRVLVVEKEFEDKKIGKQKVYHYSVKIDKKELSKAILEILKKTEEKMLKESGITPTFDIEKIKKEMEEILKNFGEIKGELWIGKKDYLLYKFTLETQAELELAKEKVNLSIKFASENSEFNQPVKVTPPSEYKDFSEILGYFLGGYGKFLGQSYSRVKDVKIISNLTHAATIAEMIYLKENSYRSLCQNFTFNDKHSTFGTPLSTIERNIKNAQGGFLKLSCYASDQSYCATADLVSLGEGKHCIDSSGKRVKIGKYDNCLGTGTFKNPYRCPK